MPTAFCPGYGEAPFRGLVEDAPGESVYPKTNFRVEWGPVFHRGRLDGSARVLIIGQDPAQHEAMARRVLVGAAGQRVQGFLARLGISTSYVILNTFLYSVFGGSGSGFESRAAVIAYRNRWIDAVMAKSQIEAVIAFGARANNAWTRWRKTPTGASFAGAFATVTHPTFPDRDQVTLKEETKKLLTGWNAAIGALRPSIADPDFSPPKPLFVESVGPFPKAGLELIPQADLPAGSPVWMTGGAEWATRGAAGGKDKRFTITVRVPTKAR